MRIAFLSSHPVPYHVPLYREMASRPGVDLEVFFTHDHGVKPTFDKGFGRMVQFDVPLLEGYPHSFPKNYARKPALTFFGQINPAVPAAVIAGKFDAAIVHGYQCATTVTSLIAPRHKTKVILRAESNLLIERPLWKRVAKQVVLRALFSRIDHFFPIGSKSAEYFESYGIPRSRITITPYSVDNAYFLAASAEARANPTAVRQRLGLPTDRPLFLYCSKLLPHKRPFDVLNAFAKARKSAACGLVYVGGGELSEDLAAEVARQGLGDDVHLLGFRNQSELPALYGACDVFVQASSIEPWGMVVNEAMACGAAILASEAVGSAYDLVRGNGAMFPVGDIDRLATLMIELTDPARLAAAKRASLKRIDEWGIKQTVDGMLEGVEAAVSS